MEKISKIVLSFFAGNHDQSYRPSNKMPPFSKSLQTLQDSLNDLKSEIKKYHCPSCGSALESYEKSNSAMETKPYKEERSPDVCQDQSNQGEKVFKHDKRDKKHDKAIPKSEKKQLEDRILELEKECKSLKMEISDKEDTIEQQFDKISRLSGMLEEREKTVSEQQSEIFRLNKSSKEFADEIQTRRNEISERDKRIENLENTQKNKEEEYEKSAQRLEDENRHLIEKLRSRQSEIEKFQTKLAEKDRINNDLSRRKSEIEVVLSFFAGNHDQSYLPSNKMPPFSNSLQKLEDSLNDLKSEINTYNCPRCGYGLESYEKSDSTMETKPYKEKRSPDVCNDQLNQDEKVLKHEKRDKKHDKGVPKSEKKQFEERILELEKKCESLTKKISDQENTVEQQFDEISRLSGMLEEREKTISEQQSEIFELNKRSEKFADEIQTVRNEISERDKLIKKLENTQKNNEEEYKKSAQRLRDELRSDIGKYQTKLAEKDGINNDLARRKSECEEKCKQLERELEKRSRKEIAVGFHTTLAPPNSSLILGGLTSRLTERLAAEKVDLVRQAYSGGPDVNFPLLVVCVNVSRIGADAKEALKGIPKAKDVALLVFHHKEAHALPSQTSDKILTGADFSGLGSIIDLAFLSQRGIYECDMNTVGIERVASFLLQYKTQRK